MTDCTEQAEGPLAEVRRKVAAAAAASGRPASAVTLIAVSKSQPTHAIAAVLDRGQRIFGENYVQEAAGRWPELRQRYAGVELHMIGALQSNKAAQAVGLFDVIQTVDRERLADAIAREVARQGRHPRLFIQVNTGDESQKAGVAPARLEVLVRHCASLSLRVDGLMAIPPAGEEVTPHVVLLRDLAREHGLAAISCGMSADFEAAILAGATHVRVGSAIFGARPTKHA
ncbi:MAG: YggS family pyridoxal phosphate-dependent enzyme [Geminicoccaceae bacterium]